MASIYADFSEVLTLAADIGRIEAQAVPNVVKAVTVTAFNVKTDWREEVPDIQSSGSRKYESSIDYDVSIPTVSTVEAVIGPNLGKPGGSFGFMEDAHGDVKSAPQKSGQKAAKKNLPDFERGIRLATGSL